MTATTSDFSLAVEGINGLCPAGEKWASRNIADGRIPLFSCEGPCIRGEIARLAANLVARELPAYARACHAETFFVPHSTMTQWVLQARKAVVIDGCFLKCHGRVLNKLIAPGKVVHFDALPLHRKYSDVFLMDDVPEDDRKATARQVADSIIASLQTADREPAA
jgi:uncharacterized metal-binding protein